LILCDSPLPEALRRAAARADHLTLAAVPALWCAWHEAGAIPTNVRLAISAGAPLPLPVELDVLASTRIKIHNFYGATECGGIAYDNAETPRTDGACVGTPMRGVRVAVDPEGCLEVRSPAVGETYWPEAGPELAGGCYRTRDLAELHGGRVFLRGRAGDLINVAGRKVSPELVERVLREQPAVKECLVLGLPASDAGRSEVVAAVVVSRGEVSPEVLQQFLLARLPPWQVPREWRLVPSLAPNSRGKLSRAEWRRRLLGRSA
jgi:acyl-coenzyme A synthetase/AMP-(fatty) acid ligase